MRAGVRLNLAVPFNCAVDGGGMDRCLQALKTELAAPRVACESVEWPNEHDISGDRELGRRTCARGASELYQKMNADPALARVKVVGPSLVHPSSRSTLGDQSAHLDRGNLHPYTGANEPVP